MDSQRGSKLFGPAPSQYLLVLRFHSVIAGSRAIAAREIKLLNSNLMGRREPSEPKFG